MKLPKVMSKQYCPRNKYVHGFPKLSSKPKIIQVGNGKGINILFIIPIFITIHGHMFEIYTMVSEIHDNVNLILGVKNVIELEAEINMRELKFKFLNRSVSVFPVHTKMLNQRKGDLLKVKPHFGCNIRIRHN